MPKKGEKVSFDYDGTISTKKGTELAQTYIDAGSIVYIISARSTTSALYEKADELGIPHSRVFATGSNKAKVEKVIDLEIDVHIDNNENVVNDLGEIGKLFKS